MRAVEIFIFIVFIISYNSFNIFGFLFIEWLFLVFDDIVKGILFFYKGGSGF